LRHALWRAVEAQHVVSTMALVDSIEEQHVLERLLDDTKPAIPAAAAHLHWLLFTPFRYPPPPGGSRFRGPNDPGSSTAPTPYGPPVRSWVTGGGATCWIRRRSTPCPPSRRPCFR
jgi:hypothetical protein